MNKIPLMDLKRQYQTIKAEVDEAIHRVLDTAVFIGGPERENFEIEYAKMVGAKYCVGVANGTDAIFLALKALGVGIGDEVITPANSFIASSEAVSVVGATVRFCDVDDKTSLINLDLLEDLLKKHSVKAGGTVKAVIPVHLYGRMVDMPRLIDMAQRFGVYIIEDTAQAHMAHINGKQAGTWGQFGTFSFYPGKNLGAYGDAGAIVTNDEALAKLARKYANHGRTKKYDHDLEGFNSRLDAMQAAVLRVKMKSLAQWTQARQEKARIYDELLAGIPHLTLPERSQPGEHVYHLYVVKVPQRDKILSLMQEKGIEASVHYPISLPMLEAYRYMAHKPSDFPVAIKQQDEILSLPLFPELTLDEQKTVALVLKQALSACVS